MEIDDSQYALLSPNSEGLAVLHCACLSEELSKLLSQLSEKPCVLSPNSYWYLKLEDRKIEGFLITSFQEAPRSLKLLECSNNKEDWRQLFDFMLDCHKAEPKEIRVESSSSQLTDFLSSQYGLNTRDEREVKMYRNAGERRRSESSQRKPQIRRSLEPGRTPVTEKSKAVKKIPNRPKVTVNDPLPWPNARTLPAAFQRKKD